MNKSCFRISCNEKGLAASNTVHARLNSFNLLYGSPVQPTTPRVKHTCFLSFPSLSAPPPWDLPSPAFPLLDQGVVSSGRSGLPPLGLPHCASKACKHLLEQFGINQWGRLHLGCWQSGVTRQGSESLEGRMRCFSLPRGSRTWSVKPSQEQYVCWGAVDSGSICIWYIRIPPRRKLRCKMIYFRKIVGDWMTNCKFLCKF